MALPNEVSSLLIGAAANQGPYQIEDSLRFRGAQYLTWTPAANGNRKTWTLSMWHKQAGLGDDRTFFSAGTGVSQYDHIRFSTSDTTNNNQFQYFVGNGGNQFIERRLRDPSAWMHFVVVVDSTNATPADRNRYYINGERQTQFTSYTDFSSNFETFINSADAHQIGRRASGGTQYSEGYFAEAHFVDGQALEPTTFGEYNDDGVWVPKEVSGVTYGSNGFYLDFSDPSNIGADRSGNGNNFTPNGFELSSTSSTNYDWLTDSPTNNQNTLNPLVPRQDLGYSDIVTLSDANLTWAAGSQVGNPNAGKNGTLVATSGKRYYEFTRGSNYSVAPGWMETTNSNTAPNTITALPSYGHIYAFGIFGNGGSNLFTAGSAANDVWGMGIDIDNGTISVWRNGTLLLNQRSITGLEPGLQITPRIGKEGSGESGNGSFNYGQKGWVHNPPAGYVGWTTAELEAVDIKDPSEYFQTILGPGPGTGSTTPITLTYKTANTADSPTATFRDEVYGKPATDIGGADGSHPAFTWATNLSLNGHDDWYVPAKNEMEIIYRNLKPTTGTNDTSYGANANAVPSATSNYTTSSPAQTSVSAFQSGGSDAFSTWYWTSTENSANSGQGAWTKDFRDGREYGGQANGSKTDPNYVRAIRRVAYTGSEPAIGASYEGGFFGGLIDAKSSPNGTATHALVVAPKTGGEYGVATAILDIAQRTFPYGLWWIKDRENTNNHQLVDSVRGGTSAVTSPAAGVEATYSAPSGNSVAWCWSAPDAFTSNAGTLATSGRRNVDTGFSIVSYAGNGNASTLGHGLSQAPEVIMVKNRSISIDWIVYVEDILSGANDQYMVLNQSYPISNNFRYFNSTAATNTVFSIGGGAGAQATNASGNNYIAYCWHSVPGYSSIGTYVGNGNADGPFIYTGFRVGWLMIKNTSTGSWKIKDVARDPYNPCLQLLNANGSGTESTDSDSSWDILSNGFKIRNGNSETNSSGQTYIYMAFAEHPFGAANVSPSPAR